MTIKGKGRTKSRGVARPPRRAPVPVPVPLARRRWVQLTAAFLLGLGVFLFAIWLTNGLRAGTEQDRADAELAAQQEVLQSWRAELEVQLGKVGTIQAIQPPAIGAPVRSALADLEDGDTTAVSAERPAHHRGVARGRGEGLRVLRPRRQRQGSRVRLAADSIDRLAAGVRAEPPHDAHGGAPAAWWPRTPTMPRARTSWSGAEEAVATSDALLEDGYRRYRLVLTNAGITLPPSTPEQPTTPLLP